MINGKCNIRKHAFNFPIHNFFLCCTRIWKIIDNLNNQPQCPTHYVGEGTLSLNSNILGCITMLKYAKIIKTSIQNLVNLTEPAKKLSEDSFRQGTLTISSSHN